MAIKCYQMRFAQLPAELTRNFIALVKDSNQFQNYHAANYSLKDFQDMKVYQYYVHPKMTSYSGKRRSKERRLMSSSLLLIKL